MSEIVVGADGSQASQRALAWALDEARRRGDTTVVVLHAYRPPEPQNANAAVHTYLPTGAVTRVTEQDAENRAEQETIARQRADSLVQRAIDTAGSGGDQDTVVKQMVVARDPARTLVEMSRTADMLVVGSRGRGGFTGLLLGSVSQQCLHHAHCPVVVVR